MASILINDLMNFESLSVNSSITGPYSDLIVARWASASARSLSSFTRSTRATPGFWMLADCRLANAVRLLERLYPELSIAFGNLSQKWLTIRDGHEAFNVIA